MSKVRTVLKRRPITLTWVFAVCSLSLALQIIEMIAKAKGH